MSKRGPLATSLGLALLLALGLGGAWAAVAAWCGSAAEDWLKRDNEYRYVRLLLDGTPVVVCYSRTDYSGAVVRTLDGRKVPAKDRIGLFETNTNSLPGLREYSQTPQPLPWSKRLARLADYRDPPAFWTFVHNGSRDGSGYFVGYDSKSKLRIGYLGTAGFRDALPPPEERFAMDGRVFACQKAMTGAFSYYNELAYESQPGAKVPPWAGFMISGERILRFDLREGKAERILDLPGAIALSITTRAVPLEVERTRPKWDTAWPVFLTIRTADHLVVADLDGRELERYVLPESVRADNAAFCLLNDHRVLAIVNRRRDGDEVAEFLWFGPAGQVLRSDRTVLNAASILGEPTAEKWGISACMPAPIAVAGAMVTKAWEGGPDGDRLAAFWRAWTEMWPALVAVGFVAAGIAGICYRRQKRYALPGTAVWVAFVFLTGVPGWLGYRFHRRWPVLDPCPACAKPSPRDREACAQCGADFPAPAAKGIEVFA